jgi:hypothetical protein
MTELGKTMSTDSFWLSSRKCANIVRDFFVLWWKVDHATREFDQWHKYNWPEERWTQFMVTQSLQCLHGHWFFVWWNTPGIYICANKC